jgi:PIN domain nuclease of toxin-antitoxin system
VTLLLDTHILLWVALESPKLPAAAAEYINEPSNKLIFSAVSIWEIAIKASLKRKNFTVSPDTLRKELLENDYEEIPVTGNDALAVFKLPNLHGDPFDRMLIAQAIVQGYSLLTSDPVVASYPGPIIRV